MYRYILVIILRLRSIPRYILACFSAIISFLDLRYLTFTGCHCCGPAPVAAIKKGDCSVNFDTAFVFSEVNADKIVWHRLKNNKWQMLYCDTDE